MIFENHHYDITSCILKCSFEIINDLGTGFLESVYKNSLYHALQQQGLTISIETQYDVFYKGKKVGLYYADLVVEQSVIVELKCCRNLLSEHQAQLINYLKASNLPVGLLINFGCKKLEYRRVVHPNLYPQLHVKEVEKFKYPAYPTSR